MPATSSDLTPAKRAVRIACWLIAGLASLYFILTQGTGALWLGVPAGGLLAGLGAYWLIKRPWGMVVVRVGAIAAWFVFWSFILRSR